MNFGETVVCVLLLRLLVDELFLFGMTDFQIGVHSLDNPEPDFHFLEDSEPGAHFLEVAEQAFIVNKG